MRPALNTRRERGAAAVEMAIVLPLLALMFLMVVDLGLIIREHQVLQNAAREGARFSAEPRNWIDPANPNATASMIQQRVVDYCAEQNITVAAGDVTINQTYPIVTGGMTLYGSRVQVSYSRSLLIPGAPLLPFGTITLEGSSVFRNFY